VGGYKTLDLRELVKGDLASTIIITFSQTTLEVFLIQEIYNHPKYLLELHDPRVGKVTFHRFLIKKIVILVTPLPLYWLWKLFIGKKILKFPKRICQFRRFWTVLGKTRDVWVDNHRQLCNI
jgi:hypothetical protein